MIKIHSSEITPEHMYLSRRKFMVGIGALAGTAALAACGADLGGMSTEPTTGKLPGVTGKYPTQGDKDELGDALTSYDDITNYNNYYEFSTSKEGIGELAKNFPTSPWSVAVGGLVRNPKTYDVDDLRKQFGEEERIYRHRCVEGWSMVFPWMGFPLAKLLKAVEPTDKAKYVRFESILAPDKMLGQQSQWYTWPYVEGLRLDEAMNNLALIGTGLYGKPLPNQNGAPIRLVVPWKYGIKNIKAIVKIDLVEEQPTTLWMAAGGGEYGFYSNVNPDVPHARWSQSTERRIGELSRRKTLPFNGYYDEVASLYTGMDLKVNF